ncbi:MAG: PEP/pyruvate-binding domain-containing protein [Bacteroidota bacterium]
MSSGRLFRKPSFETSEIGGKALNLKILTDSNFQVPPFIVLNRHDLEFLFGSVIEKVEAKFSDIQNNIKSSTSTEIQVVCEECQVLFMEFEPNSELVNELLAHCEKKFGNNYSISVRSSAMSEDSSEISFAGQHSTYLYTTSDQLVQNIKASLASAWSFGALSYRKFHNLPITNIHYAIVLQQMIFAEKAGIAFSMNTSGNFADAVINCGFGIGEGIVSDKVETDCFYINRSTKKITRSVVQKKNSMQFNEHKGIHLADVNTELQLISTLNDEEILAVYDSVLKAEKLLKKPADIEFLFDDKGELYLLQMRPITTIRFDALNVLDNTNIIESYPGITLPLSFSFAKMAYSNLFRRSARAFWISSKKFDANNNVFDNLIEHFYGRVYYRLDNWYKMMALVYNSKRSMKAWENAVGLPDSASDTYHFSLLGKIKTWISVFWLILNYKRGNKRFFSHFNKAYTYFQNYNCHKHSASSLWKHLDESIEMTFEQYHLTIINDYLAFKTFGWLQDLIINSNISENRELANELVVGQGSVESELAVLAFLRIKDQVKSNPSLTEIFKLEDAEVHKKINAPEFSSFRDDWNEYLKRFGDRTLEELKLEIKSPRQNPIILVQLVKSQLDSTITATNFKEKQANIYDIAIETVHAKLKWWMPKSWYFNWVLRLSRYGLANRENMRFCRTRVYSTSKDIFLAIAELMVKSEHIEIKEDIFFLNLEEVKMYCLGKGVRLQNIISERKKIYSDYKKLRLPDRIIYNKNEKPDFDSYLVDITRYSSNQNQSFKGVAVSKGVIEGEALVVLEPVLTADVKGKILISKMTDPGWVFLMSQAIALVTEKGSLLSHTAIVGRELGIPVVVAVQDATILIKTGDRIRVNGTTGLVEKIA